MIFSTMCFGPVLLVKPSLVLAQVATGQGIHVPVGRMAMALVACAAIALVAALLLRGKVTSALPTSPTSSNPWRSWLRVTSTPRRIRILETTRLNLRSSLVLIAVDDRQLLLCVEAKSTRLIADLSAALPTGPTP